MSTTIDQNIVEMRFDNAHFEKNVSTTMSTLDKLKQKLHLDGATKGLEDVNAAANKLNLSGLSTAAEAVTVKFSHMQMSIQHQLNRIVDSALATGKKIVSALTIDPVKTGLSEYETKINAVQVIQSNTRLHYTDEELASGKQMEDINTALSELNEYADKTIYNFAQMTSNVGKFVAQGLTTREATKAVQGLANLAAASGASAEDMARATYQMSQALGGTIRMIDWNSLRNANMATVDLKNTLKDLARVNGVAIDDMIEKHGSFEQTLQEGWLSGEMFSEAMNIYSGVYSEAELKAKGFTDEQVKNFIELAKNAESAATQVKTFTQLWDVLKETAQSGWTQTWELIIGDFDTAKKTLTDLQVYFSNIINAFSDTRNFIIGAALKITDPWKKIVEKLDASGLGKIKDTVEAIGNVTKSLEYYQDVVTKVWRGDYNNRGDNPDRFDLLDKAGYDHRVIQDLVNKGYQYELTMEDVEASHKKFGLTMETTTETTEKQTAAIQKLTDEQLEKAGLTENEISLYRALEKQAAKTGISIEDLVKKMSEQDGRTLLIDSLKNAWDMVAGSAKAIKEAFVAIFNPPGAGELAVRLYFIIDAIKEFSEKLRLTDKETGELNDNGKKVMRTFKGIFAVVKVLTTILGGAFKIAFNIISQILGYFNLNILDVTAAIGDVLVKFGEWFESLIDITWILDAVVPLISSVISTFRNLFDTIKNSEAMQTAKYVVQGFVNGLKTGVSDVWDAACALAKAVYDSICAFLGIASPAKETEELGKFTVQGFVQGLLDGLKIVWGAACAIGTAVLNGIKSALGIEPGSTDMEAIGAKIGESLVAGVKNGVSAIWSILETVGEKGVQLFKELDMGTIISGLFTGGIVYSSTKISSGIGSLVTGFGSGLELVEKAITGFLDTWKDVGDSVKDTLKSIKMRQQTAAIKSLVMSLLLIVAALMLISLIPQEKLWPALAVLGILSLILIALAVVVSKLCKIKELKDFKATAVTIPLISLCASLILVAFAARQLAAIPEEDMGRAVVAVAGLSAFLLGMYAVIGKLASSNKKTSGFEPGSMLVKLSIALLLMLAVVKLASKLTLEEVIKASGVMVLLGAFFVGLIAASKLAGKQTSLVGSMLIKMSIAILLMLGVVKLAAQLSGEEVIKAMGVITLIGAFFVGMIAASKLGGKNAAKAGAMLLMMSAAILILTGTIFMIGNLDDKAIIRGLGVVIALEAMMAAIIYVSKFAGKNAIKAGVMLAAMGFAIGVIAVMITILSMLEPGAMYRALGAIVVLEACMAGIIAVTKVSKIGKNTTATLTRFIILIALLAAAVIGLSFIEPARLAMSVAALVSMMGALAGLMAVTKVMKNSKASNKTLLMLMGIIAALAGVVYLLSTIRNPDTALKAVAALVVLMGAIAGLMAMTKVVKNSKATNKTLLTMVGIIAALAGIVLVLALIPNPDTALKNVVTLSLLMGALTVMLAALTAISKIPKGGTGVYKTMAAMLTLAVALIPMCYALLAIPDMTGAVDNLKVVGVIAGVMEALMIPLAAIGALGHWWTLVGILALTTMAAPLAALGWVFATLPDIGDSAKKLGMYTALLTVMTILLIPLMGIGALIGVSYGICAIGIAALAAMAGPLAALGWVYGTLPDAKGGLTKLGVYTALLTAMTLLLIPLSVIGLAMFFSFGICAIGIAALAAMAGPLAALGWVYGTLPDAKGGLTKIGVYTALLTAMTLLLIPLSVIGFFGLAPFTGIIALTAMVVPLATFAFAITKLPDCSGAMPSIVALITLMSALTDMLFKISIVAPLAVIAVAAIAAFGAVITAFCLLAGGLGALIDYFPDIEKFINKGVSLLITLAEGIGKALGSFISSFAEEVMTIIPSFGQALSDFMTNAQTFIEGARSIDDDVVKGIGKLGLAIAALVAADFLERIASFNNKGESFDSLGTTLEGFIENVLPGITALSAITMLDPSVVDNLKTLAEALAIITGTEIAGGLVETGTGLMREAVSNSVFGRLANLFSGGETETDKVVSAEESFKNKLVALADGLKEFSAAVKDIKTEDFETAMNVLKILSEAPIPEASLAEKLVPWAKTDETLFGAGLTALADGMTSVKNFKFDTGSNGDINTAQIKAFADCLNVLASAGIPEVSLAEKIVPWANTNEVMFAKGLSALAEGMKNVKNFEFDTDASGEIDTTQFKTFTDCLNILASAKIPEVSLAEKLIPWANTDAMLFGKGLTALANGVSAVAATMNSSENTIDTSTIESFASAINTLSGITYPEYTWVEKLLPFAKDETSFAQSLYFLGFGLGVFYNVVCGTTYDAAKMESAISALNTLTTIKVPEYTWAEKLLPFAKDETLFALSLCSLGAGLGAFYNEVCGKNYDGAKLLAAVGALGILTTLKIPDSAWYEKLTVWCSDESVFASGLKALGNGLSDFYTAVCDADFDAEKLTAAANAMHIVGTMVSNNTMTAETATAWSDAFSVLGDGLKTFCEKIDGFSDQLSSVTKISDLITRVSNLSSYISELNDALVTLTSLSTIDVSNVSAAVQSIVDIDAAALATACTSIAEAMSSLAEDMISEFVTGVDNNLSTATDACTSMGEDCVTAASEVDYSSAGKDVVTGFANGITLYTYIAKQAAKEMANAAEKSAKDALDINSPSKVFRKIGTSVPEGFAQGIGMLGGTVKHSTENMARTSVESVKKSIARLADVVNNDIDAQPTIRPVLDLSDVHTGVNAIDNMLNTRSTMGVVANVSSINSMMNRRSQNGANSDIISAIDKLNNKMDNLGNVTYQINGVTYDDGSNITDAVRTIVRAARIERRI